MLQSSMSSMSRMSRMSSISSRRASSLLSSASASASAASRISSTSSTRVLSSPSTSNYANQISNSRSLFTRAPPPSRLPSLLSLTAVLAGGTFLVAYYADSRSAIHSWIAMPILHTFLDPEDAQKLAINLLSTGYMPKDMGVDDDLLATELFGRKLSNPIGLAAGFDKQAQAVDGLLDLGFGIVEVGSVTPQPQPGNPQPRYFRLAADEGAINRFGFNSDGHDAVLARLRDRIRKWVFGVGSHNLPAPPSSLSRTASEEDVGLGLTLSEKDQLNPSNLLASHMSSSSISSISDSLDLPRSLRPGHSLFVNLGKNKTSEENDNSDYIKGVETFGPYSDALVINVSSPNTPGLRSLQGKTLLNNLLRDVNKARNELPRIQGLNGNYKEGKVPIVLKVSSDLHELALKDVANVARAHSVDGIIISNTTTSRPESLISDPQITNEAGGLSGKPLKPLALKALRTLHSELNDGAKNQAENKISLIGCGGIGSGKDALDFAKAGADVVELYTAFGYKGIGLPRRVKDELAQLLKEEGKSWKELVGTQSKKPTETEGKPEDMVEKAKLTGQDTYRRTVAGIKAEIEALRASLTGSTETSASFDRAIPEQSESRSSTTSSPSSASSIAQAPTNPNQSSNPKTSMPVFKADPADKEYTSLLEKVNKALGINVVSEEESLNEERESLMKLISEEQRRKELERNKTLGEKLRSSLDWALLDPDFDDELDKKKKASKVLSGKETGLDKEGLDSGTLEKVLKNEGKGSAELDKKEKAGAGTKDSQWRIGMGGPRPDLKMADAMRVV